MFLVAFAVPVTVYTLVSSSGDFDSGEEAAESEVDTGSNVSKPRITSVPSTEVLVGDGYSYKVRASDDDDDELEYRVTHMPSWLEWDEDLFSFDGIPSDSDIGSHRIEVTVSDGMWVDTQTFELDVLDQSGAAIESSAVVDQRDNPVVVQDPPVNVPGNGLEDRGVVSTSTVDSPVRPSVLGESTLPNTSIFTGVLGLSVGVGVVALAAFLWIDTRVNISERTFAWFQYQRGRQIKMDVGDGVKVKKRKIRI